MADLDWAHRLAVAENALSRREQELIAWISSHPHRAAFARLQDLCAQSGVSKPIVISCYRQLGYGGYQEFLDGIQEFYAGHIDSYHASAVALQDLGTIPDLVEACLGVELDAIETLRKNLDPQMLEQIVRRLIAAPNIAVYGDGTGFYPGHYLAQRLRSLGLKASLVGQDREHVFDDLAPIGQGDAFVSFFYTQDARTLARALDLCAQAGGTSVVLAGFLDTQICRQSDYHLFVPRGSLRFKNSMALPMAFAHILLLGVELCGGEAMAQKLKLTDMHRKGMNQVPLKEIP